MAKDFRPMRKKCNFCKAKVAEIDYKDVATLSRYLNRWNKIDSAGRNGNCAKHQRWMTVAIKRARHLALLPFTIK
ncbi:MAG: 30S ribosomal protein S18 [Patescibacteria group bacterium]|jgi:small subunit ribosomal protein S18